jgi:hypothetical protein
VNAIMDAADRSAQSQQWEPVQLFEWRGGVTDRIQAKSELYDGHTVMQRAILPDGRHKLILKESGSGDSVDRNVAGD